MNKFINNQSQGALSWMEAIEEKFQIAYLNLKKEINNNL